MPVTYTYKTYLPLKVFNNPLFPDVVWQVADPQVPRLAHHLALRARPRARLLASWASYAAAGCTAGQVSKCSSPQFTSLILGFTLLTSTCSQTFFKTTPFLQILLSHCKSILPNTNCFKPRVFSWARV